jgi:ABC-type arginine transport system permease subunit
VLASGYRVGRWEFRRDVRLALLLLLVLLFILFLRGLGLLVLLVLLFFRLQHALEDLLELAESIGSCLRQVVSGCDRER